MGAGSAAGRDSSHSGVSAGERRSRPHPNRASCVQIFRSNRTGRAQCLVSGEQRIDIEFEEAWWAVAVALSELFDEENGLMQS